MQYGAIPADEWLILTILPPKTFILTHYIGLHTARNKYHIHRGLLIGGRHI